MDRFFVLLLQQTLDNFCRRHFHGIESETLLYIYTDDIGQFRIISFRIFTLGHLICLDGFNLLHGSQVRRKFRFYLDNLDDRLIVTIANDKEGRHHSQSNQQQDGIYHRCQVFPGKRYFLNGLRTKKLVGVQGIHRNGIHFQCQGL